MENSGVEIPYNTERLLHETSDKIMNYQGQYGIPSDYNQADYPPVKMRNNHSDLSETQRKRRSKNRLSNRKSTGYVTEAEVEAALKMGAEANSQ